MSTTIQLLHASDLEGGLEALNNATNFALLVEYYDQVAKDKDQASFLLSAGDNMIPGPFYAAGGDPSMEAVFNEVFNAYYGLPADIDADGVDEAYLDLRAGGGWADIALMNLMGFDASAIGNHEFDAGEGGFFDAIMPYFRGTGLGTDRWVGAQFPYLSANLDFTGTDFEDFYTDQLLEGDAFAVTPAEAESISAKYQDPQFKSIAPAAILSANGEQIGVIGVTTPYLGRISSPGQVTVINEEETTNPDRSIDPDLIGAEMAALAALIQPQVDALTEAGINKVVLITHLQDLQYEKALATQLFGVDVIIAGGSDTLLANEGTTLRPGDAAADVYPVEVLDQNNNPVHIVSSDGEYSYLGRLEVTFDDNGLVTAIGQASGPVATTDAQVESITGLTAIPEDSNAALVQTLVEAIQAVVTEKDGDVAGYTDVYLEGNRSAVRTEETNLGSLSAQSMLEATQSFGTQIALKNGGGIRAEIGEVLVTTVDGFETYSYAAPQANPLSGKAAGGVSQLAIENSMRFNNELTVIKVDGEGLKAMLEHGVAGSTGDNEPGQFAQVAGVSFAYDLDAAAGSRVTEIALTNADGFPTQIIFAEGDFVGSAATDTFSMVTLSFLAGGGDGYPFDTLGFDRFDTGIGEQQALYDYMARYHGTPESAFNTPDLPEAQDAAIQNLDARTSSVTRAPEQLPLASLAYETSVDVDASEIVKAAGQWVLSTDSVNQVAQLYRLTDDGVLSPVLTLDPSLSLATETAALLGDITSVDIKASANGLVAVAAYQGLTAEAGGHVVVFEVSALDSTPVVTAKAIAVGVGPDSVILNAAGTLAYTANEGEVAFSGGKDDLQDANAYQDAAGSISVVDLVSDAVTTIGFDGFTLEALDGVRLSPAAIAANNDSRIEAAVVDIEPEYVALSADEQTLFVTLQENNAVAKVDLSQVTPGTAVVGADVMTLLPLGVKDHSLPGQGLDPSNRDGAIAIAEHPVQGLYMPDAIASYAIDGVDYFVIANEGDGRGDVMDPDEKGQYGDEIRIKDIADDLGLDLGAFDGLTDDADLGRLKVSATDLDTDGDNTVDQLLSFGARSFSIFTADGTLVYDSGDDLEAAIAQAAPAAFNSDDGSFDGRSDDKGPEPEALEVFTLEGSTFAAVGLERTNHLALFDITDPTAVRFVDLMDAGSAADISPEEIEFTTTEGGKTKLIVANEVSGSIATFDVQGLSIGQIQGQGLVSPLVGETVRFEAVITSADGNYIRVQDPKGTEDGDALTSDGLMVYNPKQVGGADWGDGLAVGDRVQITGVVEERFGATQIKSGSTLAVLDSDRFDLIPDAVNLAEATIPTTTFDDLDGAIEREQDGLYFWESLEHMAVSLPAAQAVQPTDFFGDTYVAIVDAEGAPILTSATAFGGARLGELDGAPGVIDTNPEIVILEPLGSAPTVYPETGQQISALDGPIHGFVDYSYDSYRIRTFDTLTVSGEQPTPEVSMLYAGTDGMTIASYNVRNLSVANASAEDSTPGGDNDGLRNRFDELAEQVVLHLHAPDVLALQEIQDDSGETDNGVVVATETLAAMIDAIVAAGGPRYVAAELPPTDKADGGAPGANIRVAYLYNPSRVSFDESSLVRIEGAAFDAGGDPDNAADDSYEGTRKPLMATFEFMGETATVVNVHNKSKSGSEDLTTAEQPATDPNAGQRAAQFATINAVVQPLVEAGEHVIVLGDFNDYDFDVATDALTSLSSLTETVPLSDRYSYNYDGNSQVLDQIHVSENLLDGGAADYVHINIDFNRDDWDYQTSDHDPLVARFAVDEKTIALMSDASVAILERLKGNLFADGQQVMRIEDADGTVDYVGLDVLPEGALSAGVGYDAIHDRAVINGHDGDESVQLSVGRFLLKTHGGDDVVKTGAYGNFVMTGEGDDTIYVDGQETDVDAGAGNDSIVLQGGEAIFVDTGAGQDTVVVDASSLKATLLGFTAGVDRLDFSALDLTTANLTVTQSGVDVVVRALDGAIELTVVGDLSNVTAGDVRAALVHDTFAYGVASGDPDATSVVLWTHVSTGLETVSGTYEVSTDREFTSIVDSGVFNTDASDDFTVKVVADGLEAGQEYFYRFLTEDGLSSTVGRTKTLPEGDVSEVSMAVFACANYPAGFFTAYGDAATQEYDALVHLGDYIYEYGVSGYASENAAEIDREHRPENEILTLSDYNERYQQYHSDLDLQAARASAPMIMMWDDHETANDSWTEGAENHDPESEGAWMDRRDAALEAYFNWNPVREPVDAEFTVDNYRSYDFGDLVSLHMLETRLSAREAQLEYPDEAAVTARVVEILTSEEAINYSQTLQVDLTTEEGQAALANVVTVELVQATVQEALTGDRDMIGETQMQWLLSEMEASKDAGVQWQVLGSQTLMTNMSIPAELLLDTSGQAITDYYTALVLRDMGDSEAFEVYNQSLKVPYNLDAWDGYGAERAEILNFAGDQDINLVAIAGDTHNAWYGDLVDSAGDLVGVEFATPGITSPGLESYFADVPADIMADLFANYVDDLNYAETQSRGYLELVFTKDEVVAEFNYVDDVFDSTGNIVAEVEFSVSPDMI